MIKNYRFLIAMLGLAAMLSSHAEDKPAEKAEPAPLKLPDPAKRYLDFYTSAQLNFSIDPDSISIIPGPDAEVRYTLKATSQQGAVNISYEGIRCNGRQKIIYAVGRSDGSWSQSRSPEWTAIYLRGINIQHATLANGYFCSVSTVDGSVERIIKRIESKKALDDPGR